MYLEPVAHTRACRQSTNSAFFTVASSERLLCLLYPRLPAHAMETLDFDLHEIRAAGFHRPRIGPILRRSRLTCRPKSTEYTNLRYMIFTTLDQNHNRFEIKTEILLSITCHTACHLHGRNINQPLRTTLDNVGSIWGCKAETTSNKIQKEHPSSPQGIKRKSKNPKNSRVVSI